MVTRKSITIAVVLALGLTAAVAAQERPLADRIAGASDTIVFAGAATADWVSTYRMLEDGGIELHPLLRPLDKHPIAVVTVGAALDVAGYYLLKKTLGKKHPKWFAAGLYVAAAFRVWLAVRNERLSLPGRRQ